MAKKQKFNYHLYQANIASQLADAQRHLVELEENRVIWDTKTNSNYEEWRAWSDDCQNTRTLICSLELQYDPQYMCEICYSDRHAYEVIEMVSEKEMVIRALIATRVDNNGMSDSQDYTFRYNPDTQNITVRKHKNGAWYEAGGVNHFVITKQPHEYYDFSF